MSHIMRHTYHQYSKEWKCCLQHYIIHGHLYRGFIILRNAITTISSTINEREPGKFGRESKSGPLLPRKFLMTLLDDKVVTSRCTSKCKTKRCRCKSDSISCVTNCHKDSSECKDKEACKSNDSYDLYNYACIYPYTYTKLIVSNLLLIEVELNYNFLCTTICQIKRFI